jgi:hypothetical protein
MTDPVEDICDALVEHINGLVLSLTAVASKPENPPEELKLEHPELQVLVVPIGETATKIGRGGHVLETYQVALWVVRKLSVEFNRARLSLFTREVTQALRGERMAGHVWSGDETLSKYAIRMIHETTEFFALVQLTYTAAS